MTYSWHQDFFENKVRPLLGQNYGYETGLWAWLEITDKQAYDELTRLEQLVNDLWLDNGEHSEFKQACRAWYEALLQSRGKWVAAMRGEPEPVPVPVEAKQEKLI